MEYTKLQAILGDDGLAELRALHLEQSAVQPAAPVPNWQEYTRGLIKSWTTWFAGALVVLPQYAPEIIAYLQDTFGPDTTKRIVQAIGVVVFLLRLRTKESIKDKGTPPEKGTSP